MTPSTTTPSRACSAPLRFIKTAAGKTMPVDADPKRFIVDPKGPALYVTEGGTTVRGIPSEDAGAEVGYISHFATCPNADSFRKPRKSTRKKGGG